MAKRKPKILDPRQCAHCGKEFRPKRDRRIYCGDDCRYAAWDIANPRNRMKSCARQESTAAKPPEKPKRKSSPRAGRRHCLESHLSLVELAAFRAKAKAGGESVTGYVTRLVRGVLIA